MNTERGRTLTESLMTLAIIGILSVVGLWGYSMGMNRHYTNEILNQAQMRALSCATQIQSGHTPSLSEFKYNTFKGGTFDTNIIYTKEIHQFGLKITNVPQAVCQNILNTIGSKTPLRRLSLTLAPTEKITTCYEDGTDYLMVYNEDIEANDNEIEEPMTCKNDSECKTECATCKIEVGEEEGVCVGECDSACEEGDTCGDNECVVCDSDSETKTCQNQCEEVEYLKSNGSQYIESGIIGNQNTKLQIKIQPTALYNPNQQSCQMLAGGFLTTSSAITLQPTSQPQSTSGAVNNRFGNLLISHLYVSDLLITPHTYTISKTGINVDDVLYSFSGTLSNFTSNEIYLMRANTESLANVNKNKVYFCKIWDDGTLVRDFIPVHTQFDTNGKHNCMFDRVSKKLFCSETGTDFTAGPKK